MEYPYCPTHSVEMTALAFGRCVTCLCFVVYMQGLVELQSFVISVLYLCIYPSKKAERES